MTSTANRAHHIGEVRNGFRRRRRSVDPVRWCNWPQCSDAPHLDALDQAGLGEVVDGYYNGRPSRLAASTAGASVACSLAASGHDTQGAGRQRKPDFVRLVYTGTPDVGFWGRPALSMYWTVAAHSTGFPNAWTVQFIASSRGAICVTAIRMETPSILFGETLSNSSGDSVQGPPLTKVHAASTSASSGSTPSKS